MTTSSFTALQVDAALAALQRRLLDAAVAGNILVLGSTTPALVNSVADVVARSNRFGSLSLFEPDQTRVASQSHGDNSSTDGMVKIAGAALDDLRTDPAVVNEMIRRTPLRDVASLDAIRRSIKTVSATQPLLADDSFDAIVIDLALNRLSAIQAKGCIFETFRVLKRGGRVLLTAILADAHTDAGVLGGRSFPQSITTFPVEAAVTTLLEQAGLHGVSYLWASTEAHALTGGTELRYFIVEAFKGKQGICLDQGHAVILKGPWKEVWDDDGHKYVRGERTAVCEKTYRILMQEPYREYFIGLPSRAAPDLDDAPLFDCSTPRLRDPLITRGVLSVACKGLTDPRAEVAAAERAQCC